MCFVCMPTWNSHNPLALWMHASAKTFRQACLWKNVFMFSLGFFLTAPDDMPWWVNEAVWEFTMYRCTKLPQINNSVLCLASVCPSKSCFANSCIQRTVWSGLQQLNSEGEQRVGKHCTLCTYLHNNACSLERQMLLHLAWILSKDERATQ